MSRSLQVVRASPGLSVQDQGRPGYLTYGVSQGGAADPVALAEGAALLGQGTEKAAIEMAALGGVFVANTDLRIALTGAPMLASLDGQTLAWNASHLLASGATLTIGAARSGTYGYLSVGGGVETAKTLGSRSTHLSAGIGTRLQDGAQLPIGADDGTGINQRLLPDPRWDGGVIHVVPSQQTALFDASQIARFEATRFRRDLRSNRMGARLTFDGDGFSPEGGLSILSEVIVPGDIQVTGDGTPFVLMCECQTVGGYPRIGTVLPSDLVRVAQASASADLHFKIISLSEAAQREARAKAHLRGLRQRVEPLIRDPRTMPDLLSYQLVSGVTAGEAD